MLTDEQVAYAAAETMVTPAAIRAAALTLCAPRDARTAGDVIAVAIRLLDQQRPSTARPQPALSPAALGR